MGICRVEGQVKDFAIFFFKLWIGHGLSGISSVCTADDKMMSVASPLISRVNADAFPGLESYDRMFYISNAAFDGSILFS